MKARIFTLSLALLVLCSGCNSTTPQATPQTQSQNSAQPNAGGKPPVQPVPAHKTEFMKAQKAFQLLMSAAHLWDMDAKPASLQSAMRKENPSDGSSCVWGLIVVSEKKKQINTFIWSGISATDAPIPGIIGAKPAEYQAGNPNTTPFDPTLFKVDSDIAFAALQKKNGGTLVNKEDSKLKYTLKYETTNKQLMWHIDIGPKEDKIDRKFLLNAASGIIGQTQK